MKHASRWGALVAASALTVTGLTLVASPAQAAVDTRPQSQAVSWLIGQASPSGIYYNALYDFNDYGLGADTAIALAAVGGQAPAVKKLGDAVRDNYYNFVTGGSFGPDDLLGGTMGKALVVAQVAETKPAGYANRVQSDVEDLLGTAAPIEGRIQNAASYDANVFGQSYVARGLATAGSASASDAVDFLLLQQCTDGHFRQSFSPKADLDQSCNAGLPATNGDTVGATATAVINLQAIVGKPGVSVNVPDAIADAQAWLAAQQNPDGSWGADGGNANTTGLAAWALGATSDAAEAAQWLRDHQANDTDTCTGIGAADVGAVAFVQESLVDGRAEGITAQTAGEWQRATSQSLVALGRFDQNAPAVNLALSGPTGYVRAGSTVSYKVTGAAPGSRVCVEILGKGAVGTANASGTVSIGVKVKTVTGTSTARVTDANGNTTVANSTKILAAKKLVVTPAVKSVKKNKLFKVTVSGLAAGEKVSVARGGSRATGVANSAGKFTATLNAGPKVGKIAVVASGQFADIRKGAGSIKVVK